MEEMTTFTSDKEPLNDMLKCIRDAKVQLPEFQRGWVWDNDHIISLLASISLSYPVGAVMLLETGNPEVRFKSRAVEGLKMDVLPEPEKYILDGQQRLTSLFQALFVDAPVETKDTARKKTKRWYYMDIDKALAYPEIDREDAIISVHEDRKMRNFQGQVIADYSDMQKECAAGLFPLNDVFDTTKWMAWQKVYSQANPEIMPERFEKWNRFYMEVLQRFQLYQVPLIILKKHTPRAAICQVFEKVNTGGVSLNVFELLTAMFAADNFNLREDWEGRFTPNGTLENPGRIHHLGKYPALRSVENTDFLQVISLLSSVDRKNKDPKAAITCKKKDVLRLTLAEYKKWADPVSQGFVKAAKFMTSQKIFASRDLPYRTQLVPLTALYTLLGEKADTDTVRSKLARWYWCGVFGELYGGAIETRFAKDLVEVSDWIAGAEEPSTIVDSNFSPDRLYSLRTRNSAAYKGIHALLMLEGGLEFKTGEPFEIQSYFDDKIDIHHVFPRKYCQDRGIPRRAYDCVVNKTPLAAKTNRSVGKKAPSKYLALLEKSYGILPPRMDAILKTHLIDSQTMRKDDFEAFFQNRMEQLLDRIEKATGKHIARPVHNPDDVPGHDDEDYSNGELDEDD